MKNLYYASTRILGGFWKHQEELVRSVTIHSIYEQLRDTGRFDALRCDWKEGEPGKPHVFWDSDVAKWIEAAAYLTETKKEPELERIVDEAVELIEKNQKPSGYFNSYFITVEPGVEFARRSCHELYCAGHLIEAALAYERATGKDKLLKCMIKYADYIYRVFYVEKRAAFVTPGHEEIELALLMLYRRTGDKKYLTLSKFFIDERGLNPTLDVDENQAQEMLLSELNRHSDQSALPVRQLTEAFGHAVRAGYLYTAMADLAAETEDAELMSACHALFSNITEKKMSITGGVGAVPLSEGFSFDYDIPNLTSYNETCAAIALSMFAGEMQQHDVNAVYGDVIERIWFNGFLSGMSLSGDAFFYENALEIDPKKYENPYLDQKSMPAGKAIRSGLLSNRRLERAKMFNCMCCPPNTVRFLATVPRYMYTQDGDTIYCNQFAPSRTELTVNGKPAVIEQKTDYPFDGKITFLYHGDPARLAVRVPGWCVEYEGQTEKGFAWFKVTDGAAVEIEFPMNIHFVEANPNVQDCAGRYAVMRGPFVYCMEGVDNGENLRDVELLEHGAAEVSFSEEFGAPVIAMAARRRPATDKLYQLKSDAHIEFTAKLIPYFCFANRGVTEMLIWTNVR